MPTEADPIVNTWYQHLDKGQNFVVVDHDQENEIVEIQYKDGDLEQMDLNDWYDLSIEPMETPEDWTAPVDDIERDDLDYTDTGMKPDDWRSREQPARRERWQEAEESDDWDEGYPQEEPWEEEE